MRWAIIPSKWPKPNQKKIAATNSIFEQLNQVNAVADSDPTTLRISMGAKATVKVEEFSRGGKKRVPVKAADHDFNAKAKVTPVGVLLPEVDELFLACVTSKVTSDCLVDILELWWQSVRERFEQIRTLVINLDNGQDQPEPSDTISQPHGGLCPDLSLHHQIGLLSCLSEPNTILSNGAGAL